MYILSSVLSQAKLYEPCHEKSDYCICENNSADHLHCNRAADQHLCFVYIDSTSPILPKSEFSGL